MNAPYPGPGARADVRVLGPSDSSAQPGQPTRIFPERSANSNPDPARRSSAADTTTPRACPRRVQLRLAFWIVWPTSGPARRDALRIVWSTAIAALPCTLWLAAPERSIGVATFFALVCAAAPGTVAAVLAAARERQPRATTSKALWQAGAEPMTARLITAARTAACASLGALIGAAAIPATSPLLRKVLPHHSPLRPMLAASPTAWLVAIAATVILATAGTLAVGAPFWNRLDRSSATWRRPATLLIAVKALTARSPLR